ncbi:MAG TPA: PAS domain S-box protein [Pseudolabrys sp.]|nr:PAS domain S-box protein [Pseudolabrys sp.]
MRDATEAPRPAARPVPLLTGAMLRASGDILDMLPVATLVCGADGAILQYNRRAVEIWGRAPEPGQSHKAFTSGARFYNAAGTEAGASMVEHVLASGEPVRDAELRVERPDGSEVFVSVNIDPLRNARGELVGVINCFLDITERRRMMAALEESRRRASEQEQRFAATYEHAAIGISEVAPDGHFLRVNEAICGITGRSREDLLSSRLFRYTHADDVDPDRASFRKQVDGELEFYSIEKRLVRPDGRDIWVSVRSSPVRAASGELLYVVRVVQDISERKIAERRQKLLIDELNHRVKNTLATVQSLAAQTARAAPSPPLFRERFEGRLAALSKAHDQLTMRHWENAELRALLTASLAPYAGASSNRIVLRGEDLVLRPRAVLTLAMAFHELTTNAAKYGALSVPSGRVEIVWRPEEENGRIVLRIGWYEQGGPPVASPDRHGFGSRLIEGSIAAELGGSARLDYAPEGVTCEMTIPMEIATGLPRGGGQT